MNDPMTPARVYELEADLTIWLANAPWPGNNEIDAQLAPVWGLIDDWHRLTDTNKRLWAALLKEGWPMKCDTCGHEPAQHDIWNRCDLASCLCRHYTTGKEPIDLPPAV